MRVCAAPLALLLAASATAAPVRFFSLDTPRAMAGARSRGVAVFPDGSLQLLPPLEMIAQFEEPLGLALAVASSGVAYVGTGHPARLYRVEDGRKTLIADLPAEQVTALALTPDGTLFVSTALPSRLFEVETGKGALRERGRLDEGNIWDLAVWKGELWAAASDPGRVLRLDKKGLETAFSVPDRHARCLEPAGERLYVGTSGKGMVVQWDGKLASVLFDSEFTEIADLQLAPDGLLYASGLTGDPTLGKPAAGDGEASVSVSVSASTTPQTEKGPATSEIIRVHPATGAAVAVYRFSTQVVGPLAWSGAGLVVGTTVQGELWQVLDGGVAMLDTVEASQVSCLEGSGEWVLTVGPVTLLRRQGPPRGTFTSPVLDAGQPAIWGAVTLFGQLPPNGSCRLSFRSGPTPEAGEAWSEWSSAALCTEVKAVAPPARFLQTRLEMESQRGDPPPRLGRLSIAFRQLNLSPVIRELTVHPPGEVFLKGPPPSERVVEVQHPDLSGIFTVLDEEDIERQQTVGRKYYRVGYQSLSWKVDDPNGDPLRFALAIQRQGSDAWWTIREDLETLTLALDTGALADGWYRFRLSASDARANPDAPATHEASSSWTVVDNTPPRLTVRREGQEWIIRAEDALSPIAILEWNRDARGWQQVTSEDGLVDSRTESFRLPVVPGSHVLTVRAVDASHNRAVVAVEER